MKKSWWKLGMSAIISVSLLAACGTAEDDTAGEEPVVPDTEETETEEATEGATTLIMGTSADYPPYESIDLATGEIIGFDVDIAKYITEELGYELQIEDMDFDGLIPAMGAGRVDFVMAGMTPTEARQENADFSDIYFTAKNLIVSNEEDDISSVEDLEGLKVGVQLGSIQEGEAEDLAEEYGFEVVKLNRIPEIVQELLAGRIDAILMEDTVAAGHMGAQQQLTSFELEAEGEVGSAIAFPKGSDLVEPFNEKLNELIDSGKMEELVLKWFDAQE
ncbi:transporter substrate-binding domain-containing protein [Halalkalibacter alkaliphilus]|uniref:Transporter substrate-binding domain-containing protein n=1 Tax=Halalkalibacter alkaliphilus TaxID=2917993 RepID=A0A9X2I2W7_9BACI|nr:transporter substrate-binding domain-containing protein [Halalkalibacter alkaliphilus]MCL7747156.1 transporter substrate-binding domain-containing protein [Halalkalibacter alkaliphilus]